MSRIDCRITENYLRESERMLASMHTLQVYDHEISIQERIDMVQKWSDAHQPKTLLEDFYEKFPDAPRGSDGYPRTCAEYIYGENKNSLCGDESDCRKCWDMPYNPDNLKTLQDLSVRVYPQGEWGSTETRGNNDVK